MGYCVPEGENQEADHKTGGAKISGVKNLAGTVSIGGVFGNELEGQEFVTSLAVSGLISF